MLKTVLTPHTMHIFMKSLFAKSNKMYVIIIVAAELINKNSEETLTLLVTVNIFHKGSSGNTNSHAKEVIIPSMLKSCAFCVGSHSEYRSCPKT